MKLVHYIPWLILSPLPALACGPSVGGVDEDGEGASGTRGTPSDATASASTGDPTPDTTTSSDPGTTGDDDDDDNGTTGGLDTSGDGGSSDDGGGFIMQPDGGGCLQHAPDGTVFHTSCFECDMFQQDCPRGEKCNPWANDGGQEHNAKRCAPIADNPVPVGEVCTMEGSAYSGIDDCEFGSFCWGVDPDTNEGICVPVCEGERIGPECGDGLECLVEGGEAVVLCLPACDPLDLGTCARTETCVPAVAGFVCTPQTQGVAPPEDCQFDSCDPGSRCDDSGLGDCEEAPCCVEYCDLSDPSCPDAEDVCTPLFAKGEAPGFEDVGSCLPG